ncbi:MAG: hypothetical protein J6A54_00645 [Clostridia bacterium]|nr:hypothetical protein [Clostridia bacterium]
MKNKSRIVVIISVFLILISLVCTLFFDENIGSRVATVITVSTAIVGAGALFIQFKRDKDLNEASFLVDYSVQFYNTYNCGELMNELETCRKDPSYVIDTKARYKEIVGYLEWLESLASLIKSKTISLDRIDDVLSYRYFLIVNNKQIQDCELVPCKDFYRGIYDVYDSWASYKKSRGLPIIFEENALSNIK